MERKQKEILFPLLVVLGTAILFFAFGYVAASLFGLPNILQPKPASEPEQTSSALTTTSTALASGSLDNLVNTTTSILTDTSASISQTSTSVNSFDTTITTTKSTAEVTTTSKVTTTSATTTTEATTTTTTTTGTAAITGKINLNTATKEELMTVPGIGPAIADNIIQYREEFGPFTELIQLMEVKGIGEKRYNKWIDYFTID